MDHLPTISAMSREDTTEVVSLVARSMNAQEAEYALESFGRHFAVEEVGAHDGRYYFLARQLGRIVGFTGLHHWAWGPKENVWLGWFAIEPDRQGEGLGTWLLRETEKRARELDFQKLFVETYAHPDFKRAITFYMARGFRFAGGIEDWLPNGEAMVVLLKEL